jgi:hypothetical protein
VTVKSSVLQLLHVKPEQLCMGLLSILLCANAVSVFATETEKKFKGRRICVYCD